MVCYIVPAQALSSGILPNSTCTPQASHQNKLIEVPGARARETGDKLSWAEEVLVSKADLEEKKQRIAELHAQVQPACEEHLTTHTSDSCCAVQAERGYCLPDSVCFT